VTAAATVDVDTCSLSLFLFKRRTDRSSTATRASLIPFVVSLADAHRLPSVRLGAVQLAIASLAQPGPVRPGVCKTRRRRSPAFHRRSGSEASIVARAPGCAARVNGTKIVSGKARVKTPVDSIICAYMCAGSPRSTLEKRRQQTTT
jgi:hypothetical protein